MPRDVRLKIGELATRAGVSVSAIRFYADEGLLHAMRTNAGQRRFARSDLRRVSFILIAQKLGLSLDEIRAALARLPDGRTPTQEDWRKLSTQIQKRVQDQMDELARIRDRLDGCIGCGCLSLEKCALYNADDAMGQRGPGARRLIEP